METTAEVFADYQAHFPALSYSRLPITDEQSPIPHVFDSLMAIVLGRTAAALAESPGTTDFVFNCQMGRGRTTTGMVIAMLLALVVCNGRGTEALFDHVQAPGPGSSPPQPDKRQDYLRGGYRLITKLVAVLASGKRAKQLADHVIDQCSALQNLRECIYDYKLKWEAVVVPSSSPAPAGGDELLERGLNYMIRYFYIVTFSGYLLETVDPASRTTACSFEHWLGERREITNLVSDPHQIDFS